MNDEEHFARAKNQFKPQVQERLIECFMNYNNLTSDENDQSYNELLSALTRYELDCKCKMIAQLSSTQRDALMMQQHITQLESLLSQQQIQLKQLEETLSREQTNLKNRREYDALSGIILQYEDRQIQYEKRDALRQQLDTLEKENNRLISLIELRHKQFAFLMHTIKELTTTLESQESDVVPPSSINNGSTTMDTTNNEEAEEGDSQTSSIEVITVTEDSIDIMQE
jgi:exonuclease VII large subunit